MSDLSLRRRHRSPALNVSILRRVCRCLLEAELNLDHYDLTVHFVADSEMAEINQRVVSHKGTTDVITVDYSGGEGGGRPVVEGELFVCVPEARRNAREYGVPWTEELVRYIVHGVLHLMGHDDLSAVPRRAMKAEENRIVGVLAAELDLGCISNRTQSR